MFAAQTQRFGGIEDIFSGVLKFATVTALPLYTQYANLKLLRKQAEFQKQVEQVVATPPPAVTAQPRPGIGPSIPWGMIALGGGGLFLAYILLTSGGKKRKA